ncbi:hypothetical protein PTSG_03884 [Salpingoeca rosetta]|uniref:Uncharacterized protein n=1 Tax=Salpingoeca rosetta (strain ATCC 50818 / BSB-021) TaxID=946362 RepID=F2U5N8_SALR5|nr:uncharacterized protein PTSG_03884 [Salpingoeca rosetta]EGD83254.1 hypothetical protein PTSG_03884 [Salpingoeca rosetta]|eukprot:XP_004995618.1 hypothetical protein PTSG_03884 [Salpingoeca rosetta]
MSRSTEQQAQLYQQAVQQRTHDYLTGLQQRTQERIGNLIEQQQNPVAHMFANELTKAMTGKTQEELLADWVGKGFRAVGKGVRKAGDYIGDRVSSTFRNSREALDSVQSDIGRTSARDVMRDNTGFDIGDPENPTFSIPSEIYGEHGPSLIDGVRNTWQRMTNGMEQPITNHTQHEPPESIEMSDLSQTQNEPTSMDEGEQEQQAADVQPEYPTDIELQDLAPTGEAVGDGLESGAAEGLGELASAVLAL